MKKKSNWDIAHIDMRTTAAKNEEPSGFFEKVKNNWKKILILALAIYLIIVCYGIFTTRYYVNEDGEKVAYRMSFSDLKKEDDYCQVRR